MKLLLIISIICLSVNLLEGRRLAKDKSELYRRYPQLSSNKTNNCVKALSTGLVNVLEYPYNQMTLYSTHQINDLGSYSACKLLAEKPEFAVLSLNISQLTFSINFGFCMPNECMQADYQEANVAVTNLVTSGLQLLLNKTQFQSNIIKNFTVIQFAIHKSDEIVGAMRDETQTGFVVFCVLFGIIMLTVTIIPSFYHISRIQRGKCTLFPDVPERVLELARESNSQTAFGNINNSNISNDQTRVGLSRDLSSSPNNLVLQIAQTSDRTQEEIREEFRSSPRANETSLDQMNQNQWNSTQNDGVRRTEQELTRVQKAKLELTKFSFLSGFKTMRNTRCKEWDDNELDILECFKFVSFIMIVIISTSFFLMSGATYNTWKLLDFFQLMFFSFVISCNNALDVFIVISGFLGTYKCLQIYEANDNSFTFKDALKLWARKIMRILPLFYIVFFFGWFVGSRLQSGPIWYSYGSLFYQCDQYWWANLLFVGNLFPFFTPATSGCMYWSWGLAVDVQLYLVVPIYAILYMKWRKFGIFFTFLVIAGSMTGNVLMCIKYNLTAGPLSTEDYYLFSMMLNKPWAKLCQQSIGALVAFTYWEILKYRKVKDENKAAKYPYIHFMHTSPVIGKLTILIGAVLMITILLCNHEAVKNAYAWPQWKNLLYYAFARPAYTTGISLIFLSMIYGHFNLAYRFCRNSYFRSLGKLSFESACISPIIIVLMYCGQDYSLYLTSPGVLYLGVGNILSILAASFFVYLLVEYPLKNLVQLTIMPRISHDKVLRRKYMPEKQVEVDSRTIAYKLKSLE